MIERKVAESLWPDFVKKLDADLAEVDKYVRELCPVKRKYGVRKRDDALPRKTLLLLVDKGPMTLQEIVASNPTRHYSTIQTMMNRLVKQGLVIRLDRALYGLPTQKRAP